LPALQIVVFYCAAPGRTHAVPDDPTGPEQIDLLYRSARAAMPDVAMTILTSRETDLSSLTMPFERVDGEIEFDKVMFERTRMQREYVERRPPAAPLAFLDSDILICRDFTPLFAEDFDIALTWREDREMPFNGGVIFANSRRPDAVVRFFSELEAIYRERQQGRLEWYGDQYALTELVGLPAEKVPAAASHESRGIRFRFLPCDAYNRTPPARPGTLFRGPGGAYLMHFKGVTRRFMVPFWTHWLDPNRGAARWPRLGWTALTFALTRRSYRHRVNQDQRRFNLDSQDSRSWRERAAIAAEFLGQAAAGSSHPLRVLDIGCGDCKMNAALAEAGLTVDYRGYDLLPQHSDVTRLDISSQDVPDSGDAAVSLGVVEYLDDAPAMLRRLRRAAPWLVISHAAKDLRSAQARRARRLQWRTYMTVAAFERALTEAGYTVVERRVTPDQKSCVWLAREEPPP
jgi:hypothetical protein